MQDVDRVAHIQALPQPTRHRGPRVQHEPQGVVPRSDDLHGIARHMRRRRHLGQKPAVRPSEPKLAIGLSLDLESLLVDRTVMSIAEQGKVGKRGGASLRPVTDVMALAEADATAREATAAVPVVKRPP